MSTELEDVIAQALKLTPDERAALIEALVGTVQAASALHPAWDAEIARRVAEMDADASVALPAEQVLAELNDLLKAAGSRS